MKGQSSSNPASTSDSRRITSSNTTTSTSIISSPTSISSSNPSSSVNSLEPESYFGSFLQKKGQKKPGILEAPPAVLKATGTLSEREYIEIEVISKV